MILILSLLISFLLAYQLVCFVSDGISMVNFRMNLNLSLPFGIAISSVIFTIFSIIGLSVYLIVFIEFLLAGYLIYIRRKNIHPLFEKTFLSTFFKSDFLFFSLFILYIYSWLMNAGIFYFDSIKEPHGLWDAWAYWNLKARFISRAPFEWPALIHQLSSEGFHSDYPLLQTAFIARCWILFKDESVIIPILTSFVFTFCTIGLLSSSVSLITNKKRGLLAGLVLLSTPFFITLGDSQYADVTVAFFILSTLVLLSFADKEGKGSWLLLLATGASASFAAWSKNEGLLFIVCLLIVRIFSKRNALKDLLYELKCLLTGMLPVLVLLFYYKTFIAQPNDLLNASGQTMMEKISDISRYEKIAVGFSDRIGTFGEWIINPWWIFLLVMIVYGFNNRNKIGYAFWVMLLMLVGYFFSYVISYIDLDFHLSTSLHRLFFQLFPAFLFSYFVWLKEADNK